MPRQPTTPFLFLLTAALAAALLPGRPARAGIVLAVVDPQDNGVVAQDGTLEDFAPASDSPAHASAGNARSSLKLLGSQMALSVEASGTAIASTGVGPSRIATGEIPILIEGTAGEAAGSPVTLQLQAGGNVPQLYTVLQINDTPYSVNQTHTITDLAVGEQFELLAFMWADGKGDYTMTVSLSVQAAPGLGAPVPEPSSLTLMSAGLVPMLVARLRRRRA